MGYPPGPKAYPEKQDISCKFRENRAFPASVQVLP
jgi:hypothetical protein